MKEGGNSSEITVSAGDVKLIGRVDGETSYLVKLNNTSTFIPLTGKISVALYVEVQRVICEVDVYEGINIQNLNND